METMFGNVIALVSFKRVGPLLTGVAFAILVAGSGNTADLPRRINARPFSNAEKMDEALSVVWQNRNIWLRPLVVAFLLIAAAVMIRAIYGLFEIPRLKV